MGKTPPYTDAELEAYQHMLKHPLSGGPSREATREIIAQLRQCMRVNRDVHAVASAMADDSDDVLRACAARIMRALSDAGRRG